MNSNFRKTEKPFAFQNANAINSTNLIRNVLVMYQVKLVINVMILLLLKKPRNLMRALIVHIRSQQQLYNVVQRWFYSTLYLRIFLKLLVAH